VKHAPLAVTNLPLQIERVVFDYLLGLGPRNVMSGNMASVFLIPEEHAFLLKQSPNMRVIYGLLSGERLGLPSH
jgi:hypothetical protein